MDVSLLRYATLLARASGDVLVDPILSRAGTPPPIPDSPNDHRKPLPEFDLDSIGAVLISYTRPDHFDDATAKVLRTGLLDNGRVLLGEDRPLTHRRTA